MRLMWPLDVRKRQIIHTRTRSYTYENVGLNVVYCAEKHVFVHESRSFV